MPASESMTTAGSIFAHDPSASDVYDPDEVLPQNSPLMKPHCPRLEPTHSPPAIPFVKVRPSQGDAILVQYLDGGRRPEIAQEAWSRPLGPNYDDDDDDQSKCGSDETLDESGDEEDIKSHEMSPDIAQRHSQRATEASGPMPLDLQFLATNAVGMLTAAKAASKSTVSDDSQPSDDNDRVAQNPRPNESLTSNGAREDGSTKDANRPVLAAPISPYTSQGSQELYSPRSHAPGQVLMHPNNVMSPTSLGPTSHGELAPIQGSSPKSDTTSHEALPSIRSTLLEQLTGPPRDLAVRHPPRFPHSPPAGPPRMNGIPGSHISPPISPNDAYRQGIPSPAHTLPAMSPSTYMYSSASSTSHYRSNPEYTSSNTETPNTELLTPAASINDPMSIDNMTNPVATFMCTFHGCNAPPFQTQYLLNSHANVHSSARPHYCPVKGCQRAEGGKGFKRKNEMIRHGLVHDSPGYVCPFCPDREHKYPRPDNLQRHVRVHHVDKDKDDPLLRDVLSQRPDGPSRGRRRRGNA